MTLERAGIPIRRYLPGFERLLDLAVTRDVPPGGTVWWSCGSR
jgi:hypothetical protein